MKQIANGITMLRIVFAAILLVAAPYSVLFWVSYLCCGLSDAVDGFVARLLHQQSALGAKLDSISDAVAVAAIAVVAVRTLTFPAWLWAVAGCVALIRVAGYAVGYHKYRTFCAVHTRLNKAAGVLIFLFPVLYRLAGMTATGILLGAVSTLAALEELMITVRSHTLNRDEKGWLRMPQPVQNNERSVPNRPEGTDDDGVL